MQIRRKFIIWLVVGGLAIVGLVIAFAIFNPTPPKKVVMATGPRGSSYEIFAEQYQQFFDENGIELELVPTEGAFDNIELLLDPQSGISAAFTIMAEHPPEVASALESIGTLYFEPIWFFTTDPDLAQGDLRGVKDKRLSIGPPGSTTNRATRILFELNGLDIEQFQVLTLEPKEAAAQLHAGTVNAAFIVSAGSNPQIRDLLASEDVSVVSFVRASTYTALFPALTKLTVPMGLGNMAKNLPPNDVDIIALRSILAVRPDLHPAIQTLFLEAATEIHSVPDMFHADGSFPEPRVFAIPLSSSASRFYTSGKPFLHRYLPFWLAVLVMQILVAALPLIGVLYPAVRVMPGVFDWAMRQRIFKLYGELRALEARIGEDDSDEQLKTYSRELERLDRKVRRLKVPVTFSHLAYGLRAHINIVRAALTERLDQAAAVVGTE